MKEYQSRSVGRLREAASDYAALRDQTAEQMKWEMYDLLVRRLTHLADTLEKATDQMSERKTPTEAISVGLVLSAES